MIIPSYSEIKGNIGSQKMISQAMGEIVLAEILCPDIESRAWGCIFSVNPNPAGGALQPLVEGKIRFGAAGVNIDSGFFNILRPATNPGDITKEISVVVYGSQLRVSARVTCAAGVNTQFPIGAFLARDCPQKMMPPIQSSINIPVNAGATSAQFLTPNFARRLSVVQIDATPVSYRVSINDILGIGFAASYAPGEKCLNMPTTIGQYVQIENTDVNIANFCVIYDYEF